MSWEIIATWVGLLLSVGGIGVAMGKQSQKIESQQGQIDDLKEEVKATQGLPIKLATLETDMKYLIQQLSEVKTLLQQRIGK